mgnify:CR=1 FL=1
MQEGPSGKTTELSILRSGWMYKKGTVNTAFQRRFFVLTPGGTLYWFKEARPAEGALGCIQVGGDGARLHTLGVKLSFELVTAKKAYVLRTQDGRGAASGRACRGCRGAKAMRSQWHQDPPCQSSVIEPITKSMSGCTFSTRG